MSSLVSKEEYKIQLLKIIEGAALKDPKVLRFKEMLLDVANYGDNYHTSPQEMSFEIKSTGETGYQRAFIKAENMELDFKRSSGNESVQWIDGELPLVFNKNPRRPSLDLIGFIDTIPTICELKYTNSRSSDSPLYAAIELLTYNCFIQFNVEFLSKYNVRHKNLKPFDWNVFAKAFPRLIVCANKSYWDAWFTKFDKTTLRNQVFEWGMQLDTNIHLFQSEDFDFKLQKGEGNYTPKIPAKSILEIIKDNPRSS